MHLIGCECETVIPEGAASVGGYHSGRVQSALAAHENVLPDGSEGSSNSLTRWTAEQDTSIEPAGGEQGAELVSPLFVLCGDSLRSMCEGLALWKARTSARTNPSCGTHISVSTSREWDSTDMATAVAVASLVEPAVAAATGSNSRIGRGYATAVPADGHQRIKPSHPAISSVRLRGMGRETWINLTSLGAGVRSPEHARIEFRAWTGTTNPSRLFAWAILSAALVDLIEDRGGLCFPHELFDHSTEYGTGEQSLRALFVSLGWSPRSGVGRNTPRPTRDASTAAGWRHVDGIGDVAGRPRTLSTTMQTLIELARRHDARLGSE